MKKIVLIALALFTFNLHLSAQEINEGNYPFLKKYAEYGNGLSMVIEGSEDAITHVMEQKLKDDSGIKVKNIRKDVQGVEAARMIRVADAMYDYYYRLEPISKNDNNHFRLIFFVSAGNYNFLSSGKYPVVMEAAKNWMQTIQEDVYLYQYGQTIVDQQEVIEKIKKEEENLKSEQKKLEAQIAEAQARLQQNIEQQKTKREDLLREEGKLEELKTQRNVLRYKR